MFRGDILAIRSSVEVKPSIRFEVEGVGYFGSPIPPVVKFPLQFCTCCSFRVSVAYSKKKVSSDVLPFSYKPARYWYVRAVSRTQYTSAKESIGEGCYLVVVIWIIGARRGGDGSWVSVQRIAKVWATLELTLHFRLQTLDFST
jgi:hypothetical protein